MEKEPKPSIKWWLTLIIAVLTAIAGSIGEAATGFIGKIF